VFLNLIVAESLGLANPPSHKRFAAALSGRRRRIRLSELQGFGRLASCSLCSPSRNFQTSRRRARGDGALGALFDSAFARRAGEAAATGESWTARAAHLAARPPRGEEAAR